jgi:hypothetical protein
MSMEKKISIVTGAPPDEAYPRMAAVSGAVGKKFYDVLITTDNKWGLLKPSADLMGHVLNEMGFFGEGHHIGVIGDSPNDMLFAMNAQKKYNKNTFYPIFIETVIPFDNLDENIQNNISVTAKNMEHLLKMYNQ